MFLNTLPQYIRENADATSREMHMTTSNNDHVRQGLVAAENIQC